MKIYNDNNGNMHIDMSDPDRLELHSLGEVILDFEFQGNLLKEFGGGPFDLIVAFSEECKK